MQKTVRFQSSYIEPYPLQVQGESFYRKNLEDISNHLGEEEGVDADDFMAHLILEDDNIHDPNNAVRVEIDDKIVGHLSKPAAKKYRKKLAELGLSDVIGACYASIKGGFALRSGGMADFGVRLDIDLDDLKVYVPPVPKPDEPKLIPVPRNKPAPAAPAPEPTQEPVTTPIQSLMDWLFAPSPHRALRITVLILLAILFIVAPIAWAR